MLKIGIFALTLLIALPAQAAWQLEMGESNLSFASTKKSAISEVHHFKSLTGSISNAGLATTRIDLSSIESNIPVRNTRMQNLLFEVGKFSHADINADISTLNIDKLAVGDTLQQSISFHVSLHGQSQDISIPVRVIKLSNNRLWVSSVQPIIINASQFGLEAGVAALQKIANLPSISTAVPVTFGLLFQQK